MKNNDWNLIETAPKDGTEILVYCEDTDKIYKASYLDINDNHFKPKVRADVYTSSMHWVVPESYKDSSYYVLVDPSHWMSLPTKPIVSNQPF